MRRFSQFMSTPLGVVSLFVGVLLWTWFFLGWEATWRLGVLLAALGAADMVIGRGEGLTLSEQVNRDWRRSRIRYFFWLFGIAVAIVLLHLHFTGVG